MSAVFIIFQVFLVFFIVLTVLFCFLIIQKISSNRYENKKEFWKKYYLEQVNSFIQGYEKIKHPSNTAMIEAFEEVLTRYYSLMKGNTDVARQIENLAERNFHDYYQKGLKHNRWSIRMNTLHRIEKFSMVSLVEDCVEIYDGKRTSELEALQVLRILANLQDERLFAILLNEDREFPNFYYLDIFTRLEESLFEQFTSVGEKFPMWIQIALIDSIGNRGEYKYLPFIEAYITSEDTELRIRALKSSVKIGYVTNVENIKPSFKAGSWQERMMAAKLMKVLKEKRFLDQLLILLTDESWWVRTTAAESIMAQHNGHVILEDVASTHVDRFARDVAKEWLLRKGDTNVVR